MIKFLKYLSIIFTTAALGGCSFNHYQNIKFDYNNLEKYQKQIKQVQNSYKNISFTTIEELKGEDFSQIDNPLVVTNIFIKGNKYKKENFYIPQKNHPENITPMGEIYGDNKKGIEYSHFQGLDFIVENKKNKNEPLSRMLYTKFCSEAQIQNNQCKWQFMKKAKFNNEECSLFQNIYYDIRGNQVKIQNCYSEKYGLLIYYALIYSGIRQNNIEVKDIIINKIKNNDIKPPKLHKIKQKRNS